MGQDANGIACKRLSTDAERLRREKINLFPPNNKEKIVVCQIKIEMFVNMIKLNHSLSYIVFGKDRKNLLE